MENGMISFVTAMECEAEAVIRNLQSVRTETMFGRKVVRGELCGRQTAVIVAGVGKVNAAAGVQLAVGSLGAGTILNVGVAGGLDPRMEVGDIFRVARTVEYDFDLSKVNGTRIGTPNERDTPFFDLAMAGAWPEATVATGDRFTDDDGETEFLRKEFGATLRDMELGAMAHTAYHAGVPIYSWKVVSDVAGRGAMTGQYKDNLTRCIETLFRAVPEFFALV